MSETPVSVPYRPFAIEPRTQSMTPDGFFISNIGLQIIHATISNESANPLDNVRVYIEGISDPNVVPVLGVKYVGIVPSGASFPVTFQADFSAAAAGVALVSFIIESEGHEYRRVLKKIFIVKASYDSDNKAIIIQTPQGTMSVKLNKVILGPRNKLCRDSKTPLIILPVEMTYTWQPAQPYSGKRGPLPYEDPWWKVLAIIAIWLAALAIDYFSDGSLDIDEVVVRVIGSFDETEPSASCCERVEVAVSSSDEVEEAAYTTALAASIAIAAAGDFPDLHFRGQEVTPPQPDELTTAEEVNLKVVYDSAPSPGHKYSLRTTWKYKRMTTGATYSHEATDQPVNDIHILDKYEVQAPVTHDRLTGPLRVKARFMRPDGAWYRGDELYVFAYLISTYGAIRIFQLADHGMDLDEKANDTWYTGGYSFKYKREKPGLPTDEDRPGDWYLFVVAQDVNTVKEGTPPLDAAKIIGGAILTSQLKTAFDAPCTLKHDSVIHVV